MLIPRLNSIKNIEYVLQTGEMPVVVLCSDMNTYICKYMRSSASAYKLASELIGSVFAASWCLDSPQVALFRTSWRSFFKTVGLKEYGIISLDA